MSPELIDWLLLASLQLAVVIALILLLRRPVARYLGAGFAYALWALPPLVLLTGLLPRPETAVYPAPQWLAVPQMEVLVVTAGQATASGLSATTWMLVAWAAVAGLLLLRLMADVWRGRRLLEGSAGFFASEHGIAYLSASAPCPMTVGWWRPRIVLPVDFSAAVPASRQSLIIAHEACHARRKDNLANLLARLLCCLFWFHPLVHLGWRFFRIDQELSCDAHVLATANARARRDYGHALLAIGGGDGAAPSGAACLRLHAAWSSSMRERIMMLKHHRKSLLKTVSGYCLLAVLIGSVSMASLARPVEPSLMPSINASSSQPPTRTAPLVMDQTVRQGPAPGNSAPVTQTDRAAGSQMEQDQPMSEIRVSYRPARGMHGASLSALAPGQSQGAAVAAEPSTARAQPLPIESDPAPIVRILPRYPLKAAQEGVEGQVLLEFTITGNGEVRDVMVLESEPARLFDQEAVTAMEKWRFKPVEVDGERGEVRARQVIEFRLDRSDRDIEPWEWKEARDQVRALKDSMSPYALRRLGSK